MIGVKFSYSWQLVDAANCLLKLIMAFSCNTTTVEKHFWCTQFLICYCKKAVVRRTKRKQNKCLSILPILCHCLAIHLSHSNGVQLLGQGPRTKDRHRERSSHPCNLNLSEALYNKVLGITNNTPSHSNRKIYGNLPVFGQSQLPCPFIISRFHCITITVLSFSYFQPP